MFKKKPKIIFEFEELKDGFNIIVKTERKVCDGYIYGIKEFVDKRIKEYGKNRRK